MSGKLATSSDINQLIEDNFGTDYQAYMAEDTLNHAHIVIMSNNTKSLSQVRQKLNDYLETYNIGAECSSAWRIPQFDQIFDSGFVNKGIIPHMRSLVIDNRLFEEIEEPYTAPDKPLALSLPDISNTDYFDFIKPLSQTAWRLGSESAIEQYGPFSRENALDKEDFLEAQDAYHSACENFIKPNNKMSMRQLFDWHCRDYVDHRMARSNHHDQYGDAWYSDENPFRDTVEFAESLFVDAVGQKVYEQSLGHIKAANNPVDAFEFAAKTNDPSSAIDYFKSPSVIEIQPTQSPYDTKTHELMSEQPGNPLSVIPNEAFHRTLSFANISAYEYEQYLSEEGLGCISKDNVHWEMIKEEFGEDLNNWLPKSDPEGPQVIPVEDLVAMIESMPNQQMGNLTWVIKSPDVSLFLETPANAKVDIKGGQYGLQRRDSSFADGALLSAVGQKASFKPSQCEFLTSTQTPSLVQDYYPNKSEHCYEGVISTNELSNKGYRGFDAIQGDLSDRSNKSSFDSLSL